MRKTLVVTNDFPPRPGGIQAYVHGFARQLPAEQLVVYASTSGGAARFDAEQRFAVIRDRSSMLLPTPRVLRRVREVARAEGCEAVWFGAAAPLGLLAAGLRRDPGIERVVASTHGHEPGWAVLPVARTLLHRIAADADVLTYLGDYTRARLVPAIAPYDGKLSSLPPGVDTERFRPRCGGDEVRRRLDLGDRPVAVCVSRLVDRKGQDTLIRAWPRVRRRVPGAVLLLVGDGPAGRGLARLAASHGVRDSVVFAGSVTGEQLPAHYDAGDVFAMPCRTRLGGFDVEGLGMVFLEASACGLPVVGGDSGGAPDAVRAGETGFVVDGRSVGAVADRIAGLLAEPAAARAMGAAGRAWVRRTWAWQPLAARLASLLDG
jgi:phosphatidylinositol alpha-1,6-mannosyltransferase